MISICTVHRCYLVNCLCCNGTTVTTILFHQLHGLFPSYFLRQVEAGVTYVLTALVYRSCRGGNREIFLIKV